MRRLAAAALVALALPAGAGAHANLSRATPSFRERVESPPKRLTLRLIRR